MGKLLRTAWSIAQEFCRLYRWRLLEITRTSNGTSYVHLSGQKLASTQRHRKRRIAVMKQKRSSFPSLLSRTGYWLGGRLTEDEWQWDLERKKFMSSDNNLYKAGWHFYKPIKKDRNRTVSQCLNMQYVNS